MKLRSETKHSRSVLKWAGPAMLMAVVFVVEPALSKMCVSNKAKTSIYFVPHIKDYCKTSTPCSSFKKEVKMQGSGTLSGGKVLTYTGRTQDIGHCETAIGAAGRCLIPFVSIAADPRFYNMGDIIEMPSMKGKVIKLPGGKTMIHPGFFIVQDTGGAIKGKNRFDFFTGSYDHTDKDNMFGVFGPKDMVMTDKNGCEPRKQFRVVRRNAPSYETSLALIERSISSPSSDQVVASNGYYKGTR